MSSMQLAPDGFAWCGKKGDLTLYLTHIRVNNDDEPALYIRNENRKVDALHPVTGEWKPGCPAYIVPLRDMWLFRPEDGDLGRWHSSNEAEHRLKNASEALYGLYGVQEYMHRVRDAILEFVDDVKNMAPPAELTREQWLGQMAHAGITLKLNGQAVN